MTGPSRKTLTRIKDVSFRTLVASERAVERQFHAVRLVASLAVALLLVGFLLVAQWRGVEVLESQLGSQSDQDLALLINELGAGNDELRRETLRLEQRLVEAERTQEGREAFLNEAAREMQALRVLTGLDPAVGSGVAVRIADPEAVLLVQDLVDVVNELRAAGAEAISVDGTRVGATSGFASGEGGIMLDGGPVRGDVVLFAIGDPSTLFQALEMPGGLAETLGSFPGVTVEVYEREVLEVPAAQVRPFVYGTAFEK